MLNVTFEIFILHYIMQYVGNLCIVPYMSSQNGEFIIFDYTRLLCVCLNYDFSIMRKNFAGNFSTCINNKKQK